MPEAKSKGFDKDFKTKDNFAIKEQRIEPKEILGNEIQPLDFDTIVEHLRRNNYELEISPNGGSIDAIGKDEIKEIDISILPDGAVQAQFSMDMSEIESRKGETIDDPEAYLESVYSKVIDELIERETRLERAAETYVKNRFEEEDSIEKILSDFQKHGETSSEITSSYFGDMRPSQLMMTYAVQFERWTGEEDLNRSGMDGKIPLEYALESDELEKRNKTYLRKYLKRVVEKTDERLGETSETPKELKEYWQQLS